MEKCSRKEKLNLRDISKISSEKFILSVKSRIERTSVKFLRSSALVNPNFLEKYDGTMIISTRDLDDLLVLGILSWYLDKEIGILLRLELEEIIHSNNDLFIINFVLTNKGSMLNFLLESGLWHTRDFFGNLLTDKRLSRLSKQLKFRKRVTIDPKRIQRKRGYKDKGTLKRRHEVHQLWVSTEEHNLLEEFRKTRQDTFDLLQGFLS